MPVGLTPGYQGHEWLLTVLDPVAKRSAAFPLTTSAGVPILPTTAQSTTKNALTGGFMRVGGTRQLLHGCYWPFLRTRQTAPVT